MENEDSFTTSHNAIDYFNDFPLLDFMTYLTTSFTTQLTTTNKVWQLINHPTIIIFLRKVTWNTYGLKH